MNSKAKSGVPTTWRAGYTTALKGPCGKKYDNSTDELSVFDLGIGETARCSNGQYYEYGSDSHGGWHAQKRPDGWKCKRVY
jgi:hypothetical protein